MGEQKLVPSRREPAPTSQDLRPPAPDRIGPGSAGTALVGQPAPSWAGPSREARGRSEAGRPGRLPVHRAQDWLRFGRRSRGRASARIWAGLSREARGAGGAGLGRGSAWGWRWGCCSWADLRDLSLGPRDGQRAGGRESPAPQQEVSLGGRGRLRRQMS